MYTDQYLEEYKLELENRIKNLVWTISGDYSLELKPNADLFLESRDCALYEGIKQGGLARYFDRDAISLYLVKKIYCHAEEKSLMTVAQLCIDMAVGRKLDHEREGVRYIRRRSYEEILEHEFKALSSSPLGMFKAALLRRELDSTYRGTGRIEDWLRKIDALRETVDTDLLIRTIDRLYNEIVEPSFEKKKKSLEEVLSVTLEELTEFSWKDFLDEEALDQSLEVYLDKVTEAMSGLNLSEPEPAENEKNDSAEHTIHTVIADRKALEQTYSYVQKNFGYTYLNPSEEKNLNYQLCRGIHAGCSLYYTDGILKNPVLRNYQYEYTRKQEHKNKMAYYDQHRVIKQNISVLTDILKKAFVLRDEEQVIRADHGQIIPAQLWKIGRSEDPKLFEKIIRSDAMDFVVDILIDASGSQRVRQTQVALQAYILSETLSNLRIPFRVMSFCTFWDYTVLQRYREYEDDRTANQNLFGFMTSSNNRDGLAIRAVGSTLLQREETHKVLIVLSDGKPNDVLVKRQNSKNLQPYEGKVAVTDTAAEVRRLRQVGVSVLGVFVGNEAELAAERRIFGKDFAYIRSIRFFSKTVGRYLLKQIENE